MRVGVISGTEVSFIEDVKKIYKALKAAGAEVQVEAKLADTIRKKGVPLKKLDVDTVVVIGSDRTLLETLLT